MNDLHVLNGLDIITTLYGLSIGLKEINPLMVTMINFSVWVWIMTKLCTFFIVLNIFDILKIKFPNYEKFYSKILMFIMFVFMGVVGGNIIAIMGVLLHGV
jgi:hypothetical protein